MNELTLQPLRQIQGFTPVDPTSRDLIAPLFRRQRLIAVSFLGLLVMAIVAAIVLSSQYKTDMVILVNRQRIDPMVTSESTSQPAPAPPPVTEEEMNSEAELLKSPELLREVVLANKLQEGERKSLFGSLLPQKQDEWYISKAVSHLTRELNIAVITKTNMIQVSYKSSDPQLAYGVVNKLGSLYMEKHLLVQRPTGSFDFFASETEKYKKALTASEMRLSGFGKAEGVVAPEVQRSDMAQQAVNAVAALHQAQQAIAADEQRIKNDQEQMKTTPSRSSTQVVSNTANILLQQLESNLLAARIKRTQLALKYDPSYPLVQEADEEIAETQTAIADAKKNQYINQTTDRDATYEFLRQDIAKTQADLASQGATAAAIKQSIQNMQTEMINLDQKSVKQAALLREAKTDEANYLLYLSKREQERTSDALDQKRIGNVAIAVPPILPILPAYSPSYVMVVGLFLALFLSLGSGFVFDHLDSSFRTPAEVIECLRIPVLASLPRRSV